MSATKIISKLKWLSLLSVACLTLCNTKLVIEGPDALFNAFSGSNGEIQAQYANFGHIPYG
jgi:hypothetical protein